MILTVKGIDFAIDDDDRLLLSGYQWDIDSKGYLIGRKSGQKMVYYHRLVMDVFDKEIIVDHKDSNPKNNRKENLRITDRFGNARNRKRNKDKISSMYKGVYQKDKGQFYVLLRVDGKNVNLGTYDSEDVAGFVYDINAKKHYGEFSRLNNAPVFTDEQVESHKLSRSSSSRYKGVSFNKRHEKFQGSFYKDKKRIFTKFFETEEEAYEALIKMREGNQL